MNAYQFCAEHGNELKSGRISFTKSTVNKFIKTYTNLKPEDFTAEAFKRLRLYMIDLHNRGLEYPHRGADSEPEKIELPQFIFGVIYKR